MIKYNLEKELQLNGFAADSWLPRGGHHLSSDLLCLLSPNPSLSLGLFHHLCIFATSSFSKLVPPCLETAPGYCLPAWPPARAF